MRYFSIFAMLAMLLLGACDESDVNAQDLTALNQEQLADLYRNQGNALLEMIDDKSCTTDSECKMQSLGSAPCQDTFAYSETNVDVNALQTHTFSMNATRALIQIVCPAVQEEPSRSAKCINDSCSLHLDP